MEIIAGLDIGSSKITCFIANLKENQEAEVLGMGVEYCEVLNAGHLVNVEVASRAIEEAIKKAELMSGVEVEEVHLSLPGRACQGIWSKGGVSVTERGGEKEVDYDDIYRVIEMAQQTVKLPSDHSIVHTLPSSFKVDDHVYEEPLGTLGLKLEVDVYLVTCANHILDSFARAVKTSGYQLGNITFDMVCVMEGVLGPQELKAKNIIIDLGADHTSAVLCESNSICKMVTIALGGNDISKDLSFALQSSKEEGERIKKEFGAVDPKWVGGDKVRIALTSYNKYAEVSNKGIAQIIGARCEEILQLIKKELLNEDPKDLSKVEDALSLREAGVVLVGGNASLKGMDELAQSIFQSPARVGGGLNFIGIEESIHRPEYASVSGLIRWLAEKSEETADEVSLGRTSKGGGKIGEYFKNFFT